MEATTIKADINNSKHRDDIQSLFREYAAISGSIIDDNVAGRLFELSYFKGFICYKNDEPLVLLCALNLFHHINVSKF